MQEKSLELEMDLAAEGADHDRTNIQEAVNAIMARTESPRPATRKLSFAKSRGLTAAPKQSQLTHPAAYPAAAQLESAIPISTTIDQKSKEEQIAQMLEPRAPATAKAPTQADFSIFFRAGHASEPVSSNLEDEPSPGLASTQAKLEKISTASLAADNRKRKLLIYVSSSIVLAGALFYLVALAIHWSQVLRVAAWFLVLLPICTVLALKEISKTLVKRNPLLAQRLCGWLAFGSPTAHCHLASLYTDIGNYAKGEKLLSQASKAVQPKNLGDYIATHSYLAAARARIGSTVQSEKLMQEMLEAANALKESRPTASSSIVLAIALNCMAEIQAQKQNYREALDNSRRAFDELAALKHPPEEVLLTALSNAGHLNNEVGRYSEALAYLQKAKELVEAIPDTRVSQAANIFANLGFAYANTDNQKEGARALAHGLKLAESPSGRKELPTVCRLMAKVQLAAENLAEADISYSEAIAACQLQTPKISYELVQIQAEYAAFLRKTGQEGEAAAVDLQGVQAKYSLDQTNFAEEPKKKVKVKPQAAALVKAKSKSRFPVFCLLAALWYGSKVLLTGIRVASFGNWALFVAFAVITAIKLRAKYGRRTTEEVHGGIVAVLSHLPYARYIVPELSALPQRTVVAFAACALAVLGIAKMNLVAPDTVPSSGLTQYEYYALGYELAKKESFAKARDAYEHVLRTQGPWRALSENKLSTVLPRTPQPDSALAANMEALRLETTDRPKAEKLWQSLISQYPGFEYPYIHLAESYNKGKDKSRLKEAEELAMKALSINPYNGATLHCLYYIEVAQDDKAKTKLYLDKHIDVEVLDFVSLKIAFDPKNPRNYLHRGGYYLELKDFDRAMSDFNMAISVAPNDATPYIERANAYGEMQNWKAALEDCNKAISLNPKAAEGYSCRAWVYNELGDHQKAMADCKMAISLDPKFAMAFDNLGWAYIFLGQYEKAIDQFDKATSINPKLAVAWSSRGFAQAFLGKSENAIEDCNKAISAEPSLPWPYANRGLAYEHLGKLETALKDYTMAVDLDDHCLRAYFLRAKLYGKLGKKDLAQNDLGKLKGHDNWMERKLFQSEKLNESPDD